MSSVADIIRDALMHLCVADSVTDAANEDIRDSLRALNQMMRVWESSGVPLGWVDAVSPTDTLCVPPDAEEAVAANLALRLAPRYGVQVVPALADLARQSMDSVMARAKTQQYARISYEDLPLGEGRGRWLGGWRAGFVS